MTILCYFFLSVYLRSFENFAWKFNWTDLIVGNGESQEPVALPCWSSIHNMHPDTILPLVGCVSLSLAALLAVSLLHAGPHSSHRWLKDLTREKTQSFYISILDYYWNKKQPTAWHQPWSRLCEELEERACNTVSNFIDRAIFLLVILYTNNVKGGPEIDIYKSIKIYWICLSNRKICRWKTRETRNLNKLFIKYFYFYPGYFFFSINIVFILDFGIKTSGLSIIKWM